MQNFTLGKKGISMLLFGLVLLIGSVPSYGQTCPTLGGTVAVQDFCFLATVGEIQRDGTVTAVYQTLDNTNDTQAIPSSELLSNNTTYYVGGQSGTCTRVPVLVNVTAETYPNNTLFPGENSFNISPCSSTFTAEELATYFEATITGYEIMVYDTEFGITEATGQLTPNENYFVSQVSTDGDSSPTPGEDNCPSLRVAVGYNPQPTPPPNAATPQTFCQGSTVGDLQAQGTSPNTQSIRWYRSATSFEALSNSTVLINNASYYATQIINDRNSPFPPCESQTRAAVSVTLTAPVNLGGPYNGVVCEDDVDTTFPSIDEIRKYYIALLGNVVPNPGSGTLNPNASQLADIYAADADGLGDFTTTYTYGTGTCASSVDITVSIIPREDANAGTIADITVPCGSTAIVILDGSLLSPDATTGGIFSGTGVNSDGNFDPSTVDPGTFEITYSVDDSADCVTPGTEDSTTFNIIVEGPQLGEPIVMEMCIIQVQDLFSNPVQAEAFFNNILDENGITNLDGSFDPSENVVGNEIFVYINSNPTVPQTFTTTYTITSSCGDESVLITLTINNTEEPNAGEITPAPVCSNTTLFNLNSLLGGNNNPGGTFSDENGEIANGLFDVSQIGSYNITYTVTESAENCTVGEPDSTDFTLTVNQGIVAESPEPAIVCEADVSVLFPSNDEIRKFYVAIARQAGYPANGTLNPNADQLATIYQNDDDGLGDFITTYTFGTGNCNTSVELTVSIVPKEDANAGTIENIAVPCESSDIIVLDDTILSDEATTGGTFSGTGINSDGNFDPTGGPGTYEITYSVDDSADCVTSGTSDFTKFNINVSNSSTDLGDPIFATVCEDEVQALFPSVDEIRKFYIALAASAGITNPSSGTLNPNAAQLAQMYQNDADGLGDFTTTYKQGSGPCASSVEITVSIIPREDANAGTIENITVPCESSDIVVLDDTILSDEATTGGTFSGTGINSDGNFDPAVGPGTYEITYSVDDSANCVTTGTNDATTFEITVGETGNSVGTPIEPEMCITEVIALLADPTAAVDYFNELVAERDPALDGDFTVDPSILGAQILGYVNNPTTPSQTFSTNYTYVTSCGNISTDISLTINNTIPADAGEIADFSLCENDEDFDLFTKLTSDNPGGGTFSDASGVIVDGLFDISATGVYIISYTVSEDDLETCLSGSNSTEFELTVTENTIVIGDDNMGVLCEADVPTVFPSVDEIRKYLINLLDPGVSKTAGTFNPTAAQLAKIYQDDADGFGDFKTNYTIVDGTCSSSVELTVRIKESLDSPIAEDTPMFCSADNVTLADIEVTGTNIMWFEDESLTTTADLTDSLVDGEDYYAVSVSEDENICNSLPTSVLVSIITNASPPVASPTQDFCSTINPTVGDLVITGDNITVYEDADLTIEANNGDSLVDGDYYATALCSSESIMIIVTIGNPADAPTAAANQSFCLVNNNTVANLVASGDNIVWYEDEDLTIVAPATTPLENGDVYYAVATGDNTCSSPSTMVTVTMNDPDAPTLQIDGNEFCRSDNPTLQDLLNNFNGSGIQIYASLTGGTAIASTTALQDGVQYFATATDATLGCESSERLAIRVEVAFCGIPEGFSPNGDNINDRFVIPDLAINYPNYNIEVYNRWGNMVFKGNASTPDWDGFSNQSGTLGDGVLPVGVYFYILNYNDGATTSEQGKLYLSR